MVALWRVAPAFAAITIPKGGLDVFVFDFLKTHRIESPGRLEAGDSGYLYRIHYSDGATQTEWSRLATIGEPLDRAVFLMRQMGAAVRLSDGRMAAAMPYRIVVDFSDGVPRVSLAVQYFSGEVGSDIVPMENCGGLADPNLGPYYDHEGPHWKWARVDFKGTNRRGRRGKNLTSTGRIFLNTGHQATQLVPEVDFVYFGTSLQGEDENHKVKLNRHEVLEAYTLFNFREPLLVEHPRTHSIVAVFPRDVVVDLHGLKPRVLVSVRTIGRDPFDFLIHPSALKGLSNIFCPSVLVANAQ